MDTIETTGKAPFELIMGFVPCTHQALHTQGIPSLEERSTLIQRLRWLAHKAVRHAQRLLTQRKGTRFVPYHMGDRVWLKGVNLAISHPAKKFKPRRYGPFTIMRVISDVAYRLALPLHWKIHDVFHTSLLTPYHKTRTHGPNLLKPPPDVIDGEPEWEVEEIIGIRTFGRRREKQYRVKWKGYNAAHDSWEPASNVHAPDLIEKFHKRQRRSNKGTTMSDKDLPTCYDIFLISTYRPYLLLSILYLDIRRAPYFPYTAIAEPLSLLSFDAPPRLPSYSVHTSHDTHTPMVYKSRAAQSIAQSMHSQSAALHSHCTVNAQSMHSYCGCALLHSLLSQ